MNALGDRAAFGWLVGHRSSRSSMPGGVIRRQRSIAQQCIPKDCRRRRHASTPAHPLEHPAACGDAPSIVFGRLTLSTVFDPRSRPVSELRGIEQRGVAPFKPRRRPIGGVTACRDSEARLRRASLRSATHGKRSARPHSDERPPNLPHGAAHPRDAVQHRTDDLVRIVARRSPEPWVARRIPRHVTRHPSTIRRHRFARLPRYVKRPHSPHARTHA